MILIISRDSDTTTDLVMEWLSHWGLGVTIFKAK